MDLRHTLRILYPHLAIKYRTSLVAANSSSDMPSAISKTSRCVISGLVPK